MQLRIIIIYNSALKRNSCKELCCICKGNVLFLDEFCSWYIRSSEKYAIGHFAYENIWKDCIEIFTFSLEFVANNPNLPAITAGFP
jgi:hypothetical protein